MSNCPSFDSFTAPDTKLFSRLVMLNYNLIFYSTDKCFHLIYGRINLIIVTMVNKLIYARVYIYWLIGRCQGRC